MIDGDLGGLSSADFSISIVALQLDHAVGDLLDAVERMLLHELKILDLFAE